MDIVDKERALKLADWFLTLWVESQVIDTDTARKEGLEYYAKYLDYREQYKNFQQ